MIVPMKKVSLIIMGDKKEEALKKLRKSGLVQIEISEGSGEKLAKLKDKVSLLSDVIFAIEKSKKVPQKNADTVAALSIAEKINSLDKEKKRCQAEKISLNAELERLKDWGNVDPQSIKALKSHGIDIAFYEMPKSEYKALDKTLKTVKLNENKLSVKFMLIKSDSANEEIIASMSEYALTLPQMSTGKMRQRISELSALIDQMDEEIASYGCYTESIKKAISFFESKIEFETYSTGMADEKLSSDDNGASVVYFKGYIEAENLDILKKIAADNSWGLIAEDPNTDDNVPTKLKNNNFVSLIYPLTDFLNTVPGYFEYDISGWFLAFILIFFGIIFGDGGYGLLICAVTAVLMLKSRISKKRTAPAILLIGLFGLSTVIWGTLTCTWFGLTPEQLPEWLKGLSVPVISNVYADKIWVPFWVKEGTGLTTAQNLQIFCFSLALIQLSAAHIKCAVTNRKSLKIIGDIGSEIELIGMFYLVLSFVVNGEVFGFDTVIGGIPVGTVAIVFVALGFVLSFVFSNYEGSIIKSILSSLTNIVSVLLGIFNLFSDIVSYIRLWAVGLAGAAISATVNELAGPLFGNFMFMILAIFLLVFGHGLNIILNVLSVIVHGIRLNTLEFSSHLGMSWSGYKFKPFEEKNDYKGELL